MFFLENNYVFWILDIEGDFSFFNLFVYVCIFMVIISNNIGFKLIVYIIFVDEKDFFY